MKEDHQTMLLKRMRGPQKVPPSRPRFDHGIDNFLVGGLIKNLPLEFLDLQSFESLSFKLKASRGLKAQA